MKILITGHKGFIGSRLFKSLQKDGYDVVGIDLQEGKNLLTCELPENISVVYHLAAQSSVESSWLDPVNDSLNYSITVRLAHAYPHARIIYANSCASTEPVSPYGMSKKVSGDYLKTFHINVVECIFPNIYGPGSKSVVDIFKDKEEVTVYGDGKALRDYVHVDDIVDGLKRAMRWNNGSYFMGSDSLISVLELTQGRRINFAPARKEARRVWVPNTTPDWQPTIKLLDYIKAI